MGQSDKEEDLLQWRLKRSAADATPLLNRGRNEILANRAKHAAPDQAMHRANPEFVSPYTHCRPPLAPPTLPKLSASFCSQDATHC